MSVTGILRQRSAFEDLMAVWGEENKRFPDLVPLKMAEFY
jgi:hypothetical protein